jgi:hypothetical protein
MVVLTLLPQLIILEILNDYESEKGSAGRQYLQRF